MEIRQAVADFIQDGERRLSPATTLYYRSALKAFPNYCNVQRIQLVSEVVRPHIRACAAQFDGSPSPGGAHARLRAVRVFVTWLVREGLLSGNPLPHHLFPEMPPELAVIAECDVTALLTLAATMGRPLRDRAVLLSLFDAGLHASELVRLYLDHLLPDSTLYVRLGSVPRRA